MEQYLEQLRTYARTKVEPELLDDREDLWEMEWSLGDAPKWWTLQPEDKLLCWSDLLQEDMKCDHGSSCAFVSVTNKVIEVPWRP